MAPVPDHLYDRADFLSTASLLLAPAVTSPTTRSVDVGGAVDLLSPTLRLNKPDAFFPISMEGLWMCQRAVVSVDGDSFQASTVWKALGSKTALPAPESYLTRFVPSPYDGDLKGYTVLDRAYDYTSRSGGTAAEWRVGPQDPPSSHLQTKSTQLDVVWRIIELPNDQGFGSQELIRIQDGPILRAALVKRRFRRSFDEQQNRVVEGLEVVKTFRVLDGIAGTEFPTSTVRSQLRLTRPQGDGYDVPGGAY